MIDQWNQVCFGRFRLWHLTFFWIENGVCGPALVMAMSWRFSNYQEPVEPTGHGDVMAVLLGGLEHDFSRERLSVWGSSNSGGLSTIFTSSHLHITSSILTSSHLHIFTSSHPHIFSSSHLLILTSSHLHIFTSSHLHIFSSSHLLIFTSSHLHIFSSSHLLIFTSSHLHIFTSSHLHILTSSHPLLPSCSLALLLSCPLALLPSCTLLLFYFSLAVAGQCQRDGTKRNLFARNEVRSPKTKVKFLISRIRSQPFRTKWGSIAKKQR